MKALVYAGPRCAEVREVPEPAPKAGSVPLDVLCCGVCGSDIGIWLGTHPRAKAPLILGHEFLGVVAEDGARFKKGERVATFPLLSCGHCRACRTGNAHVCNTLGLIGIDTDGGMAPRVCVGEDVLYRVPSEISDRAAVVIEPLAVIVRALHQSRFRPRDIAVVTGAGPIGILTGLALKDCGAARVIISDMAPRRLALAGELGLEPVDVTKQSLLDVVRGATDGEGADILFECSGSPAAAMEMTELTRVSGTICMVAVHKHPHEVDLRQLNFKEQTLIGTRVYTREEFGQAVEYSRALAPQLERLVTHVVPLRDAAGVFDLIADPSQGTVKVVVDCRAV